MLASFNVYCTAGTVTVCKSYEMGKREALLVEVAVFASSKSGVCAPNTSGKDSSVRKDNTFLI